MYVNETKLNIFSLPHFIKLNQTVFKSVQNLKLLSLGLVVLFARENTGNEIDSLLNRRLLKLVLSLIKETKSPELSSIGSCKFNSYFVLVFLVSLKHEYAQMTWREYDFCLNTFDLIFQQKIGPISLIKDPKLAFLLIKTFKRYIYRLLSLTCAEPMFFLNKSEVPSDFIENLEKFSQKYISMVEMIFSESPFHQNDSNEYLYNSIDCQNEIIDLISKCVELIRLQIVCVSFKLKNLLENESESMLEEVRRIKRLKKDLIKMQTTYSNKLISLIHLNESFRVKIYAENRFIKSSFQRDLFKKHLFKFLTQNYRNGKWIF
jgi:hypothetical protein